MSHVDRIADFVRNEQREIFRLACRDLQLQLKQIADLSGIPYPSVKCYAAGEAQMPKARHPASPGGVEIVPVEEAALNTRAVKLRRVA